MEKVILEKWEHEILEYALGEDLSNSNLVDPAFKPDAPPIEDTSKLDKNVDENKVYFDTDEERKKACNHLMAAGIPWIEMNDDPKEGWIKFSPDDFYMACKCLSKKYSILDAKPKKVAIIEFDDVGMYERVLQYIKRMGGILELGPNVKLDSDEDDDGKNIDESEILSNFSKKRKGMRKASILVKDLRSFKLDDLLKKRTCRARTGKNHFFD